MKKFGLFCATFLLGTSAFAQSFVDASLRAYACGGNYLCGPITVTESDHRVAPAISQPDAGAPVMGLCGQNLPASQSYQAKLVGTSCGGDAKTHPRLPMPVDLDKKDKADQFLASSMDNLTKRTKAQELLRTPIAWKDEFSIPMNEYWTYTEIAGDFNGPSETYETTCSMSREERYDEVVDDYESYCAEWRTESEPSYSGGRYSGGSSGNSGSRQQYNGNSGSSSRNSDRLKGTSSGEIQSRSRSNYNSLGNKRKKASYEVHPSLTRDIAQSRTCVQYAKRRVGSHTIERRRWASPVTGRCYAQRGTWRTYPVTRQANRTCPAQKVTINVKYEVDPQWTPASPDYLELLPNKYDLLPGESETIQVSSNLTPGSRISPNAKIDNAWNRYEVAVSPAVASCQFGGEKTFDLSVRTLGRIKRKAPNPFKLPDDKQPLVGLDDKGRPKSLTLLDLARQLREDSSMNSRRFQGEAVGTSEAGGSKAFWIGTQFQMMLFKIDGAGRRIPTTLPNAFTTNSTDIFESEMQISLGGEGGMQRLYRPAGPMEFIFGGLYKHFGVELSPNTNYVLVVKAAQREFPFYESTCSNGAVSCDEKAKDGMFSEAIEIPFKTGDTQRSWLKWLKDKQIVIF